MNAGHFQGTILEVNNQKSLYATEFTAISFHLVQTIPLFCQPFRGVMVIRVTLIDRFCFCFFFCFVFWEPHVDWLVQAQWERPRLLVMNLWSFPSNRWQCRSNQWHCLFFPDKPSHLLVVKGQVRFPNMCWVAVYVCYSVIVCSIPTKKRIVPFLQK